MIKIGKTEEKNYPPCPEGVAPLVWRVACQVDELDGPYTHKPEPSIQSPTVTLEFINEKEQ